MISDWNYYPFSRWQTFSRNRWASHNAIIRHSANIKKNPHSGGASLILFVKARLLSGCAADFAELGLRSWCALRSLMQIPSLLARYCFQPSSQQWRWGAVCAWFLEMPRVRLRPQWQRRDIDSIACLIPPCVLGLPIGANWEERHYMASWCYLVQKLRVNISQTVLIRCVFMWQAPIRLIKD